MIWVPQSNQIRFRLEEHDITWTKRGLVRRLAGIFDPMGLLAAFVVRGKMLMQELCRREKNLDSPLEHEVTASLSA